MRLVLFLRCGIIIVITKRGEWDRMEVKAVFDIDGTLVNDRKSVLKSTKDAIKIVKEQGKLAGSDRTRAVFWSRN